MKLSEWLICMVLLAVVTPLYAEPGYIIRSSVLMDEPYRDATPLAELEEGASVEILKRKGGWLQIESEGKSGWVRMSKIRKGKAPTQAAAGSEAGGVLDLASGRAGTGNVVSATGVRGLDEEQLKEAKFDAGQVKKLESFTVSEKKAVHFAQAGKLAARELDFIPAAAE